MEDMTRNPLLLLAVAAALALGACGSSGNDDNKAGGGASDQDKAFDGALKFAKCMREHGLDVPDPERVGSGGIRQKMSGKGTGKGPDDPKTQAALKDCEHFQKRGGGEAPSPAQQAKMQDAFVAYAKCMRSKGVAMEDPKVDGGRVQLGIGKGGRLNPESPAFKAAEAACHKLLAAVEADGPGGKSDQRVGVAP
jgi:hypothetical protein